MTIIDGRKIAEEILARLKLLPKPNKFLAGILVGTNPASESFLKRKEKTAKELGVDFRLYPFPANITNDTLREEVGKIAAHKTCGGVIVQLPLPEQINPVRGREGPQRASASNGINRHYILNAIPREKDVDVLGERALGAFYAGRNPVLPPAVATVDEILNFVNSQLPTSNFQLANLRVAVVGRGLLVGRPVATWLMGQVRELIVLGHNADLSTLQDADLVILGADKANIVKPDMLKAEAGIIDFGYAEVDGKLCGNLDTSYDLSHLAFYTPTPGGTGPILVAKLMENFYKLNEAL